MEDLTIAAQVDSELQAEVGDVALKHTDGRTAQVFTAVVSVTGQTVKQQPAWAVADIPCKAVYPWPPSWTLGAAQHA